MFLPCLFIVAWLYVLMVHRSSLSRAALLFLCAGLMVIMLCGLCFFWVRSQTKHEWQHLDETAASR
jgi:hypothetical protein